MDLVGEGNLKGDRAVQLGVTRVKVDAREMRCAKEKSFFSKGRKRSIYLEISPRGERGWRISLPFNRFIVSFNREKRDLVYKRLFPPAFTTISIHQLARRRSITRACNRNRFNGKKRKILRY